MYICMSDSYWTYNLPRQQYGNIYMYIYIYRSTCETLNVKETNTCIHSPSIEEEGEEEEKKKIEYLVGVCRFKPARLARSWNLNR